MLDWLSEKAWHYWDFCAKVILFHYDFGDICGVEARSFEDARRVCDAYGSAAACQSADTENHKYFYRLDNRARKIKVLISAYSRN